MESVAQSHGIATIRRIRFISDSWFMASVVVQWEGIGCYWCLVSAADDKKSAKEARHYQQRVSQKKTETFLSPVLVGNSAEIFVGKTYGLFKARQKMYGVLWVRNCEIMMFQWPVKTSQFAEKADDLEECIVQERCTQNYEHLLGRQLWSHLEVNHSKKTPFQVEEEKRRTIQHMDI